MLNRTRKLVLKTINPVMTWAQDEPWRADPADTRWMTAAVPLRFGSVDAFCNFLEALLGTRWSADGDTGLAVRAGGIYRRVIPFTTPQLAEWISEKSESERSNFSVEVHVTASLQVEIEFTTDPMGRIQRPRIGHDMFSEDAEEMRRSLGHIVRTHTVRATKRDWKAGRQVVDPIDMATDLAERHARRLALRSSTYGAAAGLLAGIAAQFFGAAIR